MRRRPELSAVIGVAALAAMAVCAQEAVASPPAPQAAANPANVARVTGLMTPMGVAYDAERDRYLVANAADGGFSTMGRGFIAVVGVDGKIEKLRWLGKLDAPKGMKVRDGLLYVADLARVWVIDLARGRPLKTIVVPDAFNITDVALDSRGVIYAVDAGRDLESGAIFEISPSGEPRLVARGSRLLRPNSIEIVGDKLVIGVAIGPSFLRLTRNGELEDVRSYPHELWTPSEVRGGERVGGIVRLDRNIVAVTNRESRSVALLDITPTPLPDPIGKVEREAMESNVEPSVIVQQMRARLFAGRARTGQRGLNSPHPVADPQVFLAHDLQAPGKVAYDPGRGRLLIAEITGNSLALVTIGPNVKVEGPAGETTPISLASSSAK